MIVMPKNCISMPKTHRWGLSQGGEAGTGKVWIQIPVDYRQRGCAIDAVILGVTIVFQRTIPNAFATAFLIKALIVMPAFWAAIATPL